MRKAITVCLWLGLGVCIVLLFSQAGQKSLLNQEKENARRKNEVLQTLYDQAKKEWQKETADLKEENSALKARISSLNEEMNAACQAAISRDWPTEAAACLSSRRTPTGPFSRPRPRAIPTPQVRASTPAPASPTTAWWTRTLRK